jgi:hypothetical protein
MGLALCHVQVGMSPMLIIGPMLGCEASIVYSYDFNIHLFTLLGV